MMKKLFITLMAGLFMLGTAVSAKPKEEMTMNIRNGFYEINETFANSWYNTSNWAKVYYLKSYADSHQEKDFYVMLSQLVIDEAGKVYKNHKGDFLTAPDSGYENYTYYIELMIFENHKERRIYIAEGSEGIHDVLAYCKENIDWKP